MKKILILSICLISLISFSVNASNTIAILDNGISEAEKSVTVSVSTANFSEGDDITLLVFKPTSEQSEPDKTNIVAINQTDYREGMTSITFNLPSDATGDYEIRIGGTNVETYTSGTFRVTEYSFGDLNGDGNYDDTDAILILRVFLELDEINVKLNKNYYDLNNDGVINAKDAAIVYKMN